MDYCETWECGHFSYDEKSGCLKWDDVKLCSLYMRLKAQKEPVAEVPCSVWLKGRLITAAASLSLHKLSEFDDDYPQRFPKRVLREIEKHNNHLSSIARELMAIKDAL